MSKIKALALSLCFAVILGVILNAASDVLRKKDSTERYAEFWNDPGEYDVWFMGTSHVYYAIQPMELWNHYGIRSYDLAAPSSHMPQVYWTMMCALQYSQPKVIVLDTYKVHLDKKYQEKESLIHTGIDSIPMSFVKIRGIYDIFDKWEDRFEYIYDFSVYHNRWEELGKDDFVVKGPKTKGARFKNSVINNSSFQCIEKEEMSDTDTLGFLYLEKIIEECQKRKIKLVLTKLPFNGTEEMQKAMNAVPKIAEKYGLECLDMIYEENLLEYEVDFGDEAHVNLFGAGKITKYIGDYLTNNCDLTDYRDSVEVAEKWNADYESYQRLWRKKMRKADEITSYVQWLKNDRYTCYMYKGIEPSGLLEKELAQLNNISQIPLENAEARMEEKIDAEYAFFVEDEKGEVLDKALFKNGKRQS